MKREHVSHYASGNIETIDYIFDTLGHEGGMSFVLANIIKYASRAQHKGQMESDLKKIRNYATIALEKLEENEFTLTLPLDIDTKENK